MIPLAVANTVELATSDDLTEAVAGNTILGSMQASGVYTEYYADGGVVYGHNYNAKWSIDNNTMCWIYVGSPKDCWNATRSGDQISWMKDGKGLGTGTILVGNPNNF